MAHATAAVALLLVALVLSIYKPRGLTGYGQRKQHERTVAAGGKTGQATASLR